MNNPGCSLVFKVRLRKGDAMKNLLKKRYSFIDITIMCLLVAGVLYFFSTRKRSYAANFPQHQVDDPQAVITMQNAFEEIVARRNLKIPAEKQKEIARLFHDLDIWKNMWYLGIPIQKNPCDLWMMQQLIYETRPDYIIEAGTFRGGATLYFAHILDGLGLKNSKVITIDIENACQEAAKLPLWKKHVEFILGSSIDPQVVETIRRKTQGKKVLVVLDSVHEADHVIQELKYYAPMVSPGSYLVVEDTNSDGVPIFPGRRGPLTAVRQFLTTEGGKDFTQDFSREALVLTFNPGGWLKRAEGK
jgi:cephalosporin hydroxylase